MVNKIVIVFNHVKFQVNQLYMPPYSFLKFLCIHSLCPIIENTVQSLNNEYLH